MTNFIPFILPTIAGLSTLVGMAFIYVKCDSEKIVKYSLSFAAGVMLCVSIIDLLPESINLFSKLLNKKQTFIYTLFSAAIGTTIPFIIDKLLGKNENELYKVGVLSMIAIIVHNIPEGIATYLSATANIKLGISIAAAITLHNIPEGISIAVPVYYGTKNSKKAFIMTLVSAISEPFGAIFAFLFLKPIITDQIMGVVLAIIAGLMSNISLIELLPKSLKYSEKKKTLIFFIIGIIFMYISINLIKKYS